MRFTLGVVGVHRDAKYPGEFGTGIPYARDANFCGGETAAPALLCIISSE